MVKPMLFQFLVQSHALLPFVEIIDNNGTWSSVTSGGNAFNGNDYYEISTLEETLPGTIAHLIINLETSDGYASNSIVPIQIGTPTVYDPVGPDDYGYYIYDNEDINYVLAPTYNWVEIDDREGVLEHTLIHLLIAVIIKTM